MRVAIIRYNGGNTVSVANALSRLGAESVVTDSADELAAADRVIFPGVGEASSAMESLTARGLDLVIPKLIQPVLGICLGMQLMCAHSEENDTACLGILPQKAKRFQEDDLKVPHIGWNKVSTTITSPLFDDIPERPYMYFVHSYYVENGASTIATTEYGAEFTSAVAIRNFYGVQFHPERSCVDGARVLENFLKL